jgi:ribosomal protein L3
LIEKRRVLQNVANTKELLGRMGRERKEQDELPVYDMVVENDRMLSGDRKVY